MHGKVWRGQVWTAHHDTGVVNQHVDLTPGLDDRVNDPLAPRLVPDILGEEETLSTGSGDYQLGGLSIALLLGEVDNGDLLRRVVRISVD